jgi:hypothetical protein
VTSETSSSQASPQRESCCYGCQRCAGRARGVTHSDLHALAADELHAPHHVLLHLDELRELLGEVRAPLACGLFTEGMALGIALARVTIRQCGAMGGGSRARPGNQLRPRRDQSGSPRISTPAPAHHPPHTTSLHPPRGIAHRNLPSRTAGRTLCWTAAGAGSAAAKPGIRSAGGSLRAGDIGTHSGGSRLPHGIGAMHGGDGIVGRGELRRSSYGVGCGIESGGAAVDGFSRAGSVLSDCIFIDLTSCSGERVRERWQEKKS